MGAQEDAHGITAECRRIVESAQATGWSDPAVQSYLGSIVDYQHQLDGLIEQLAGAPPQPEPAPVPSTQLLGFAVTYSGHDPARDLYPGLTPEQVEWGPHHNIELLAPGPGRMEAYQFPTPLQALGPGDPDYQAHYDELFGAGWVCAAPPVPRGADPLLIGSQLLYVGVYWPDTPLAAPGGRTLRACWFGHCRGDIPVGRVNALDRMVTTYDSGVRFENNGIIARAAHVHVCGSTTGQLSMNGDIDGLLVAQALGWVVEYRGSGGPGPQDYMTGAWIGGKPRAAWQGRALPPIPA